MNYPPGAAKRARTEGFEISHVTAADLLRQVSAVSYTLKPCLPQRCLDGYPARRAEDDQTRPVLG